MKLFFPHFMTLLFIFFDKSIAVEEIGVVSTPLRKEVTPFIPETKKAISLSSSQTTSKSSVSRTQSTPKPKPKPKPNPKPLPKNPSTPSTPLFTLQTPDWASLYRDIDFINRYKPRYGEELKIRTTNILLFGEFSSGKSSFINSVYTLISNRMEFVAPVSGGRDHTTVHYERYPLLDLPIELRDTWGWSETTYKGEELRLMLDGAMPHKTHMTALTKGQITLNKARIKTNQKKRDKHVTYY
jgi:hypothetical protein